MIENKIRKWWEGLSNVQQVLLIFLGNWLLWFGIKILGKWFAGADHPAIQQNDFIYSFIMAVIWTLSSSFYKVKTLFFPRNKKRNASKWLK